MKTIMNKLRYTLLLGFIALAALGNSLDAATLTVCDQNTTTNNYVPFYGYYHDVAGTTVQMIYPSTMLTAMNGGTITSVKFYTDGGIKRFSGGVITVTMGLTDATTLNSQATISGSTVSATFVPSPGMTEIELTFNPGLTLTSGKNLIIQTEVTTAGTAYDSSGNMTKFVGSSQSYNCSYCNYASAQKFLPKATFGYTPSTTPAISASPTDLTFETQPNQSVSQQVTVTGLNLTGNISVTLNGANGVFSLNNTTSLPSSGGTLNITYSPTAVGTHTATVTLANGNVTKIITLNGACVYSKIIYENESDINGYLPIYGNYSEQYQINQMIYPASELTDLIGTNLTSMTFYTADAIPTEHTGHHWAIRLGTTEQTTFGTTGSTTPRLVPTDVVAVETDFEVTTGVTKLTITFDEQFPYNGGNLLVDFQQGTHPYSYKTINFLGKSQDENTGYYSRNANEEPTENGHYTNYTPQKFLPRVKFTYEPSTPITSGTVTPAAIDFSTVGVGQSVSQTVTIKNTGNQDFVPTIATNLPAGSIFTVTGSGFDIANPPTMQPNQELVLTVTFTPTESTSYNGTITVTTVDGDNNPVAVGTVTLTGAGSIVYSGEVNPNPVSFGNVQVGQSATMTVTLTNTGNQPFTPTIDASGLNGTGFSVTPTTSGAIAPNGTQNFTVTFAPAAESFDNGSFTVTIPVPNGTPIVLTVNVTGNGYEYSATTLMSNVTDMIPVHKSDVKASGTYIFLKTDVDNDLDRSLSYGDNSSGNVEVLVKNEEPVVNYTLKHKEGENGSWSNVGTATQDSSDPKVYAYNNETFTIPNDATEMWIPMTDNRVNGSTYYYVPVTVANGIVTQGNTYGAPQVQATTDPVSFNVTVSGWKSAQGVGAHWTQTVGDEETGVDMDYCIYMPLITVSDVSPAFTESRVPYKFRAWLTDCTNDVVLYNYQRVPNANDPAHSHIEGSTPLTLPKYLGELSSDFELTGSGPYIIGDDPYDENSPRPDGEVQPLNTFAAPSVLPDNARLTIVVRAYYYQVPETRGALMLRDGEPADGYGYGEGSGEGQGGSFMTAVNDVYTDREVVDVKYVNLQGMQSDKPFDGINIVVTRYSDGTTLTTKVVR